MPHIMLDIETLGKKPGCIILSIGAVEFNPFSDYVDMDFYEKINVFDSLMKGFSIDSDTLEWWKTQSDSAHGEFLQDKQSTCFTALENFAEYFICSEGGQVWCQGATFDVPILEEYFLRVNPGVPWKFWNVRDTRTVYDICKFDVNSIVREGTYHNALADAKHQVRCVQGALKNVHPQT